MELRHKRSRGLDPYTAYVRERWEQGHDNGLQLWRERAPPRGIREAQERCIGSLLSSSQIPFLPIDMPNDYKLFESHLSSSGRPHKQSGGLSVTCPIENAKEQQALAAIRAASQTADTVYALAQDFMHMLDHREGQRLDVWLDLVRASHIPELQRFARSIRRDKDAVLAGLTLQESNGVVEGKINKLKLSKRMMYGRAEFPLLRQRVLHAL